MLVLLLSLSTSHANDAFHYFGSNSGQGEYPLLAFVQQRRCDSCDDPESSSSSAGSGRQS
ncbi:MAG: hypothetical protein AAGA48_40790 [Myxococcota bacterium]